MPRETRCTAGDETYRGRRVGSGRHGKTEWGKGVPLTSTPLTASANIDTLTEMGMVIVGLGVTCATDVQLLCYNACSGPERHWYEWICQSTTI